jgi:ApbE superfamily uncharacterized protein (UPF0280 family)
MTFEPRTYRRAVEPAGLVTFEVVLRETDLQIAARSDLTAEAFALAEAARADIESFVSSHPRFVESFVPFEVPHNAPPIVRQMAHAASHAGVGPMAAVAGAIAEHVARGLAGLSDEGIVENGGDVFMISAADRTVALHAGASALSDRVGIVVPAKVMPVAVCTSSATVGPSVSLGSADAACVIARTGALADAVASALGNRVHSGEDVGRAIEAVRSIGGVLGLIVIAGDTLGAWGVARLVPLEENGPTAGK